MENINTSENTEMKETSLSAYELEQKYAKENKNLNIKVVDEWGKFIEGYTCLTPEQSYEVSTVRQSEREGNYYYATTKYSLKSLSVRDVLGLFELATYVSTFNCLRSSDGYNLDERHIRELLNMKSKDFRYFWSNISKYVIVDDHSLCYLYGCFFNRYNTDKYPNMIAVFSDSIKELCHNTAESNKKYVAYILKMLRNINVHTNILCFRPFAEEFEDSYPMDIRDFCADCNIDIKNAASICKVYGRIMVTVNGKKYPFVKFIKNGERETDYFMVVNPYVLFHGPNKDRDKILNQYFDEVDG